MSYNPREPSNPVGDNPAGRTRGQTHRFHSDFCSNPELAVDPGRPPITNPTATSTATGQFGAQASLASAVASSSMMAIRLHEVEQFTTLPHERPRSWNIRLSSSYRSRENTQNNIRRVTNGNGVLTSTSKHHG